jgi:hypothetical protein
MIDDVRSMRPFAAKTAASGLGEAVYPKGKCICKCKTHATASSKKARLNVAGTRLGRTA